MMTEFKITTDEFEPEVYAKWSEEDMDYVITFHKPVTRLELESIVEQIKTSTGVDENE